MLRLRAGRVRLGRGRLNPRIVMDTTVASSAKALYSDPPGGDVNAVVREAAADDVAPPEGKEES